jgi:hypothetical protein
MATDNNILTKIKELQDLNPITEKVISVHLWFLHFEDQSHSVTSKVPCIPIASCPGIPQ